MAKNTNKKARIGWIRQRSQFYDDYIDAWVKRNSVTGQILDVKKGDPWKAVRIEHQLEEMKLSTTSTAS